MTGDPPSSSGPTEVPGSSGRDTGRHGDDVVLVPDDARELEADRLALLAELRDRARGVRVDDAAAPRTEPTPRGIGSRLRPLVRRIGITGPLLIVVLVLVGLSGTLVSVFSPGGPAPLARLPLAESPIASPGSVGGLLPEATVSAAGRTGDVRAIRPSVLLLVPEQCQGCVDVVTSVYTQARQYTLPVVLVGAPEQADQLAELDQASTGGGAARVSDDEGALTAAYSLGEQALTMVMVHADGVVGGVLAPDADTRYESAFVQLPRAGAQP